MTVARRRKGRRLAHCDRAAFLIPWCCSNEQKKSPAEAGLFLGRLANMNLSSDMGHDKETYNKQYDDHTTGNELHGSTPPNSFGTSHAVHDVSEAEI